MASIFRSFPSLRKAAPSLSKEFFTCRNHQAARLQPSKRLFHPSLRTLPFFQLRYQTTQVPRHATIPTFNASEAIANATSKTKPAFFPETSEKKVAYWLLGSAASVFGIVIFGGLTRLTESGCVLKLYRYITSTNAIEQPQHYRMETCHRLSPTHEPSSMGSRIRKIPILARIQTPQPTNDPLGVQKDILHGMYPSIMGSRDRNDLPPAHNLLHRPPKSSRTHGPENGGNMRINRHTGSHWLVDGKIRSKR